MVSADQDSAEVIVALVAPTSNTATAQGVDKTYRLQQDRVILTKSKANGRWLVSKVEAF